MSAVHDRLEEAARLADLAEQARRQHGQHEGCETCSRLDAELRRALSEVYAYERACAVAP